MMHINVNTIDIIIKKTFLFFILKSNDKIVIKIKNNKSISNGEMLRPLDTVTIRNIRPLI